MYQLFETIRIENGHAKNLAYHWQRMQRSLRSHYGLIPHFTLSSNDFKVPDELSLGITRARLTYDADGFVITYEKYHLNPVNSYRLVKNDKIEYKLKYIDRNKLEECQKQALPGGDILIIKNGKLADSAYANLVLLGLDGQLITPLDCLLPGTKRQYYLDQYRLVAKSVRLSDLDMYSHICRINAMIDLGEDPWVPLSAIVS